MDRIELLDCTLRDGGYITNWSFENNVIINVIDRLINCGLDLVEVGYLNENAPEDNSTQFYSINQIETYLPTDRKSCLLLAMADVQQVKEEMITPYTGRSIDGIRVVFYKHQIEQAIKLAKVVVKNGYKLFMQPMVTIDYSISEYATLVRRINELHPYAVSVVDSFGYMCCEEFRKYFKVLDNLLDKEIVVGFHSHNNMNYAFISAQDIFEYNTSRRLIIDSSLYGMGRGAGNLNTEIVTNYYNMLLGKKYDVEEILRLIGEYILPIYSQKRWGYSPYLFLTGIYQCHPNFACYLLEEYDVTVSDFIKYIKKIPAEMRTKCRKEYVLQLWDEFIKERNNVENCSNYAVEIEQ